MNKFTIPQSIVLPLVIAAFLVPIIIIELPIMQFTHGAFTYPIDDTLIHLAIAKNLAFYHTWGVSPHEFESAASSILYPMMLALFIGIFGAHLMIPILLNAIIGVILLFSMQRWLVRQGLQPMTQLLILLSVVYLTPLPVLAIAGMEHVLQLLFVFLFITQFSKELEQQATSATARLSWKVYAYALLLSATRYEGLILVLLACLILLYYRKLSLALQLGICSAAPILIFGFYALYHGNYFIPNSVMLKSGAPPLTFPGLLEFFTNGIFTKLFFPIVGYNSLATQRLLFLLPLGFLVFYTPLKAQRAYQYMLILLTAMVFIHLCVAGYVNFPRYEAYLIGCSTLILGLLAARYGKSLFKADHRSTFWVTCLISALLVFPLILRSYTAFGKIERGSLANYDLQYQAGGFLHKYYDTDAVAVEALGAVSYYSNGKKLDILGLGDIDVARALKNHYYGVDFMDDLSRKDHVGIAVASEFSTDPLLLKRWQKVATWQIPLDWGGYYISFYAVDPMKAVGLRKNLMEYQKSLPEGEKAIYY